MTDKKLKPKQQRFVDEYLIDLNATQAAIRTGYSEKTAGQIGHELLKKPEIAIALQNAQSASMVSATTGKAKLHGLVTDKQETDVKGEIINTIVWEGVG